MGRLKRAARLDGDGGTAPPFKDAADADDSGALDLTEPFLDRRPGLLGSPAGPPQIAQVFPDFPTEYTAASPHIITGEDFEPGQTEVWVWSRGKDEAAIIEAGCQ